MPGRDLGTVFSDDMSASSLLNQRSGKHCDLPTSSRSGRQSTMRQENSFFTPVPDRQMTGLFVQPSGKMEGSIYLLSFSSFEK